MTDTLTSLAYDSGETLMLELSYDKKQPSVTDKNQAGGHLCAEIVLWGDGKVPNTYK